MLTPELARDWLNLTLGVVYITYSGTNRVCGIPREIAQPFQIARETLLDYDGLDFATEVS